MVGASSRDLRLNGTLTVEKSLGRFEGQLWKSVWTNDHREWQTELEKSCQPLPTEQAVVNKQS